MLPALPLKLTAEMTSSLFHPCQHSMPRAERKNEHKQDRNNEYKGSEPEQQPQLAALACLTDSAVERVEQSLHNKKGTTQKTCDFGRKRCGSASIGSRNGTAFWLHSHVLVSTSRQR